jgi:hypothetical protein
VVESGRIGEEEVVVDTFEEHLDNTAVVVRDLEVVQIDSIQGYLVHFPFPPYILVVVEQGTLGLLVLVYIVVEVVASVVDLILIALEDQSLQD